MYQIFTFEFIYSMFTSRQNVFCEQQQTASQPTTTTVTEHPHYGLSSSLISKLNSLILSLNLTLSANTANIFPTV
jgi:hypothetical protein